MTTTATRDGQASGLPSGHRPSPVGDRASADLLIDSGRLSELVGRDVRATRLRFKPGLSTTAVLLDPAGRTAPQWIQVSHDEHLDKLRNALDRAEKRSQRVHLVRTGALTVAYGDIDTDPRLQKALDGLRELHPLVGEAVTMGDLQVLRYNPQRRLVVRREIEGAEPQIVRLTADPQRGVARALAAYAGAGVPVVQPLPDHPLSGNRRVTVWPWFGRGDLAEVAAPEAAEAAGRALARVHGDHPSGAHQLGTSADSGLPSDTLPDAGEALQCLVGDLAAIDTGAAARMGDLVARLTDRLGAGSWEPGPVHGDFSADQVLVGRPGEEPVRLTDFDRAGHGPLLTDLGTFAAAELLSGQGVDGLDELPLTGALLAGYAQARDARPIEPGDLRVWTARALLARVIEPFRAADPDWQEGLHARMDQVEQVLP